MKKILAVLLMICMIFGLSACTSQSAETEKDSEKESVSDEDTLLSRQREYARLIIEKGIGIHDGQKLLIVTYVENYEFTRLCVEAAYAAGADDVIVSYNDMANGLQQINNADEEVLSEVPPASEAIYGQCVEEKIPIVSLVSEFPGYFDGVNSERLALADSVRGENYLAYREATFNYEIAWTVAGVPNEVWAKAVFPELSSEKALAKLWDAVLDSVYVDGSGDAEELWDRHTDSLKENAAKLTELQIKSLHYTNSLGTDFTIELPEDALWCASEESTTDGDDFTPNLPTEEIFTAPLASSANGVVYASMPMVLNETVVKDIRLTVENGRIVESYASEGLDVLNACLETDEGARYFGEIALVPYDSPISQSGIIFYHSLYDENASCHMAFGFVYPSCLRGGTSMTDEELAEAGLNTSEVHGDFMIGTEDMKIVGTTYSGEEIVIFENGNFADCFS